MTTPDPTLQLCSSETDTLLALPFADGGIKAGFPSPAQDYLTDAIDLNKELVHHTEATFYARVVGDSMRDAGICDGDLLVVDKALEPHDGCRVVACLNNEFTIKEYRLDKENHCAWLIPHNAAFEPIKVTEEDDFKVWGVITYTIHKSL